MHYFHDNRAGGFLLEREYSQLFVVCLQGHIVFKNIMIVFPEFRLPCFVSVCVTISFKNRKYNVRSSWKTWYTFACNLSNITFHDKIHASRRRAAFVRNLARLYKHSLGKLFTMFTGKVVLKLLCVKNVNYTFLLFPNYLVFVDFCLKADSWIWKIFTHANKGQTTWLDSAFFFICACPHCVLGLGSNKDQRLILLMTRCALL